MSYENVKIYTTQTSINFDTGKSTYTFDCQEIKFNEVKKFIDSVYSSQDGEENTSINFIVDSETNQPLAEDWFMRE